MGKVINANFTLFSSHKHQECLPQEPGLARLPLTLNELLAPTLIKTLHHAAVHLPPVPAATVEAVHLADVTTIDPRNQARAASAGKRNLGLTIAVIEEITIV